MQTIDLSRLTISPNETIIDLGCGEGRHTIGASFFYPNNPVFGVDLNLNDLVIAKQRLNEWESQTQLQPQKTQRKKHTLFINANGFHLPFKDNSIDHIICSEVLEHIEQYDLFFCELNRILKPSGKLYLSVPRAWTEKICWKLSAAYHQVEGGHVNIFKKKHILTLLHKYHYQCNYIHGAHALHTPYWWLRCMFWKHGEYFWLCALYHRFLVWDLMQKPLLTKILDKLLNPFLGKSLVFYCTKQVSNP